MTYLYIYKQLFNIQSLFEYGDTVQGITGISWLQDQIHNDIVREELKHFKMLKPYDYANKILNTKNDVRDEFRFSHILSDGRQLVTDGCRLIIFDNPIYELPVFPSDKDSPNWSCVLKNAIKDISCELPLPELSALKAYIKIQKARKGALLYDFGEDYSVFNAVSLSEMIAVTGAKVCGFSDKVSCISFKGNGFTCYLLPVRLPKDRPRCLTKLSSVESEVTE